MVEQASQVVRNRLAAPAFDPHCTGRGEGRQSHLGAANNIPTCGTRGRSQGRSRSSTQGGAAQWRGASRGRCAGGCRGPSASVFEHKARSAGGRPAATASAGARPQGGVSSAQKGRADVPACGAERGRGHGRSGASVPGCARTLSSRALWLRQNHQTQSAGKARDGGDRSGGVAARALTRRGAALAVCRRAGAAACTAHSAQGSSAVGRDPSPRREKRRVARSEQC